MLWCYNKLSKDREGPSQHVLYESQRWLCRKKAGGKRLKTLICLVRLWCALGTQPRAEKDSSHCAQNTRANLNFKLRA